MGNISSEQGGDSLQVTLHDLDSEFEAVLRYGRDTKFKQRVLSPEEITIPFGRDETQSDKERVFTSSY